MWIFLQERKFYIIYWLTLFSQYWANSHAIYQFRRAVPGWYWGNSIIFTSPPSYFSDPLILQPYNTILTYFTCTFFLIKSRTWTKFEGRHLTKFVINKENMMILLIGIHLFHSLRKLLCFWRSLFNNWKEWVQCHFYRVYYMKKNPSWHWNEINM